MARLRRVGGPGRPVTGRRRSGPVDEVPWWVPLDQARAEEALVDRRALGRGWIELSMVNNVERLDPLGDDPASAAVRVERQARRLTGLDEGRAWRHRDRGALLVVRSEVFAVPDDAGHRASWRAHGPAALEATWRLRWTERGQVPGWLEARWVPVGERPGPLHAFDRAPPAPGPAGAIDWIRVEDHTDPAGGRAVTCYEHVTVWRGRRQVVLTVRHDLGLDLDPEIASLAAVVFARLGAREPGEPTPR